MAERMVWPSQRRAVPLLLLVLVAVVACPLKVCADEETTASPVAARKKESKRAAAPAAPALLPVDDGDVVPAPAPVYATVQQNNTIGNDSNSNGTGKLSLVATVGGSTPATARAVFALMYDDLAHRLHRLQQQSPQHEQHSLDEGSATTVAHLQSATARLSLLLQQQSQQQHQLPRQRVSEDVPTQDVLQSEQREASQVSDERPEQQGRQGQVAVVEEGQSSWREQRLNHVFLREYLADSASRTDWEASKTSSEEGAEAAAISKNASKPHFSGVRAARMRAASRSSSGGLPSLRVRRDVETALSQALLSARFSVTRWQHQADLISQSGSEEAVSQLGYVLADSCVAVDFRDALRIAARAAAAEEKSYGELDAFAARDATAVPEVGTTIEGSTLRRFDEDSASCLCPAGWTPCTKEEALRVSYGWRQTLGRACAEERQQQELLQVRAYTKGLHSFGCDGSELSSLEAKDGEAECASAAFVLCKELSPRCGVSQWCARTPVCSHGLLSSLNFNTPTRCLLVLFLSPQAPNAKDGS
ncbi:hypothetical protein Emag_006353 [Eimeria magna]